ncbi:flavin-containing monooxygenase [Ktedonospora formicarum]|uniref:4-hydroxyacetophenone monooxygenase n=1 Tax=Ktedonospora formicarum TaxID=2778364 RepID=A0A8J3I9H9_9CHLR|nr:NAD(P)/FAD-dependent oxidoreductase [Ktedonospora formicarum]GHO47944.1 4-hydroxyacetophenone monooxygenase [Ktedonospora formicarum]
MFQVFASKDARKRRSNGVGESAPEETLRESEDGTRVAHMRVAILGTGFSGLGMAIRLKRSGEDDFVVIERASDIGGTWRDNTYPGCACDIPSHLYSFSFALNPRWSRMYSPQSEIRDYLRACAKRFGILPHIWWESELLDASWSEEERRWHIQTSGRELTADILILGNGPLCEPSLPQISGIEDFKGTLFHSARWRHDYDLAGKRVGVIGTGASAIQFVPRIQPQVAHLTLFQRTPPWVLPRMDHDIPAWQQRLFRILPLAQRLVRTRMYWERELTALGMVYRQDALKSGADIASRYLERSILDPALREKLTPRYAMGCKRILLSDDFYRALNQPNIEVVTEGIREVRAHSIVTSDGIEHEVDTIICGTGFHVTDTEFARHIHGRDGLALAEAWREGTHAYLGTSVAGFPNMFLLIGPNTGLGHNSMVYMIESQISYILGCLRSMRRRSAREVEIRPGSEERYNEEMQRRMQGTIWSSGCKSWYLDARGRNTTIWPGFTFEFRHRTRRFDPRPYDLRA